MLCINTFHELKTGHANQGTKLAAIPAMSISDVIIIYLALGAPVAMFRFFQQEEPFSFRCLANVAASFVFWPFFAINLVAMSSKAAPDASIFVTRNNLDVRIIENVELLKEDLLANLDHGSERKVVSAQAEAIERYIGLSLADTDPLFSTQKELLAVSGHPDATVAIRCLARRSLHRLDRHRSDAAADVIAAFAGPGISPVTDALHIEKVATIAQLIGDVNTAEKLRSIASSMRMGRDSRANEFGENTGSKRSHSEVLEEVQRQAA